MPSRPVTYLSAVSVAMLYSLVPKGRWRQLGKWVATALVALLALARMYLGVDTPVDVLVGAAIGVTIPLLAFRWFTPNDVFPVSYQRGRSAHLDIGGARGEAIRRALSDQLGLEIEEVKPFGLAGSAGSTPLRIKVRATRRRSCSASCTPAATCARTGGTSSAASCSTAAWRTRSRSTPCGGWSSRRTTPCTSSTWPACRAPTLRLRRVTPDREYLLVTEFFDGAAELGDAEVESTRASSTTAWASSASCGTPAWPTATSSRPTCWSATAACC